MAETDAAVAIYWDFENVHACVLDDLCGKNTYHDSGWSRQKRVVDVARVADYAATFGRVVVHRAYGNWQFFSDYSVALQEHAIDLVQMFPLTKTKNGADIRLALDVVADLGVYPLISHVVVVSSDSDYTALAQRCRSYGRRFVGVGTGRVAEGYRFACDEFRRYDELPVSSRFAPAVIPASATVTGATGAPGATGATFGGAGDLVEQAVRRLAAEGGAPWVLKAAVLPAVQRLDPAFSHKTLGFATFPDLVAALDGRIVERAGQFDHELAVRADLPAPAAAAGPAADGAAGRSEGLDPLDPADPSDPFGPAALIEGLLRKKKLRLPVDKQLLWMGTELIAEIFVAAPDGIVASFDSLWQQFEAVAAEHGIAVSEAEFKKLKAILWRAHAFEPLGFALGIRLREPDAAELRLRAVATLLGQLPEPAAVTPGVLAEAIFGSAATAQQQGLISAALLLLAEHPEAGADPGQAACLDADDSASPDGTGTLDGIDSGRDTDGPGGIDSEGDAEHREVPGAAHPEEYDAEDPGEPEAAHAAEPTAWESAA
jgi:hypothetical protein